VMLSIRIYLIRWRGPILGLPCAVKGWSGGGALSHCASLRASVMAFHDASDAGVFNGVEVEVRGESGGVRIDLNANQHLWTDFKVRLRISKPTLIPVIRLPRLPAVAIAAEVWNELLAGAVEIKIVRSPYQVLPVVSPYRSQSWQTCYAGPVCQ
jgi:hypothetical protein